MDIGIDEEDLFNMKNLILVSELENVSPFSFKFSVRFELREMLPRNDSNRTHKCEARMGGGMLGEIEQKILSRRYLREDARLSEVCWRLRSTRAY